MSSASLVCIGDELVSGAVVDVHGSFLASYLAELGIEVQRISLVGDDERSILAEAARLVAGSDLVILTGGLGPTSDDRTRVALAMLVGQQLEFDEELWRTIQQTLGRTLSGSNRRQAFRPALFKPLVNTRGTAPGLLGEVGGCRVVALPGPPHELRGMVEHHGDAITEGFAPKRESSTVVSCFGIPESRLEDALGERDDLSWHTRAETGRIILRLKGGDEAGRQKLLEELFAAFGRERFATGETTLPAQLVAELASRGETLSAAESCTGGLLGAAITDVPGSSDVLWGSIVSYANDSKIRTLGLSEELLTRAGAVSEEVVVAMAESVHSFSGSDYSTAISGVAGPAGGTEEKPVGTVWIALRSPGGTAAKQFSFRGDRWRVRRSAVTEALLMIRALLPPQ